MPDGETYTHTVSRDYSSSLKGKLVQLKYDGSVVSLSAVSEATQSGSLDIANRKFAGKTVLKDAKIIHRLSDEDDDIVSVEVLDFETLGVSRLEENQIINIVSANSFGDIGIFYLENMSSAYKYGYLMSSKKITKGDSYSYQYDIFDDGIETEYPDSAVYSVTSGTPVRYKTNGNSVSEIYPLKEVASAARIGAYESGRIMINSKVYYVDDDVEVVQVGNTIPVKCNSISVTELGNISVCSIKLYAEKDEGTESNIKVIVIR